LVLIAVFYLTFANSAFAAVDPCTLPVDSSAKYLNNSSACGKSCSDSFSGTFDQPLCTFSAAMSKTPAGGTLKILPGIYREGSTVNRNQSVTIIGLGDMNNIILTAAKAIDETLFTADGGGVYSAPLSALGLGTSSNLSVLILDQGKTLVNDPALGCTYSFDVSNGRLRIKLDGDPLPTSHTIEIVENSKFNAFLYGMSGGVSMDLDVENIHMRGLPGTTFYLYQIKNNLRFDNVLFDFVLGGIPDSTDPGGAPRYGPSGEISIYMSGGNVHLSNIEVRGSHNLSYWARPSTLFTQFNSDSSRISTYLIESTKMSAHTAFGGFDLANAASTATVDGLQLYSAGFDHTGISLGRGGPGSLLVKNSVFASFDYTGNIHKPYACYFTDGREYQDAAHDFFYSDVGAQVHARFENNLIAYGYFAIQFQAPASGSHIAAINNIFINNPPLVLQPFVPDEWDYNMYFNSNDPYGAAILSFSSSSATTLSAARSAWLSGYNCSTCDSHSLQVAPNLVSSARNDLLVYDFRPAAGSNVCGAGKGGKDIGPFPCAGGDLIAPGAPKNLVVH